MKNKKQLITATSKEKIELINDIQEAVAEMKLIKQGKLKGVPAEEMLDNL